MQISTTNLQTVIFSEKVTDYCSWKKNCQYYVSQIGQYLLDFNENQISSTYSIWEEEIKKLSNENGKGEKLLALLGFSVLHFFSRSYEQAKRLFPMLKKFSGLDDRDIVRATSVCIKYISKESDNFSFLREALESSKFYFTVGQRDSHLFNGLSILKECGKLLPNDVFAVTLNYLPEIWQAICSSDLELQSLAVALMEVHLKQMPANTKEPFAESLKIDCFSNLNNKVVQSNRGTILVLKALFIQFPKLFQVTILIEKLVNSFCSDEPDQNIETHKFLLLLERDNSSDFQEKHLEKIVISLIKNIKNSKYQKKLFSILKKTICIFKNDKLPINLIINMIVEFSTLQNHKNLAFLILCKIFKYFPNIQVPNEIFTNGIPCKNSLRALRMRIDILIDIRGFLMNHFRSGIEPQSTYSQQKVSLMIFCTFQRILFEKIDELFSKLRHFAYSPYEKIRLLISGVLHNFSCNEAIDELVRLAMMDDSKHVRLCALKSLKAESFLGKATQLSQLLADPSYSIRRTVIPLIAEAALSNSLYTVPTIILFVNSFLSMNISHSNPARSAKACSLLPLIAEHFIKFADQFIPNITWFCLWFLLHGDEIPELPHQDIDPLSCIDLRKVIHRDFILSEHSKTYDEHDIFYGRVYNVENAKWIAKCDANLFNTLERLSPYLRPYLYQVIPVFIRTFSQQQEDIVYISALKSLTQIVIETEGEINFLTQFPSLLPTLIKLIGSRKCSKDVAIALLTLTGTMGASSAIVQTQSEETDVQLLSIQNTNFFTDFTLKSLKEYFTESSTSLCTALCSIFTKDPTNSLPYLDFIVKSFVNVIEHETNKDIVFNQLELIIIQAGVHFIPFLPKIYPELSKNLSNINCIHCCISLSFHLRNDFTEFASNLYPSAIHLLSSEDPQFFKTTLKFISFAILYQNQNAELFIETLEFHLTGPKPIENIRATFLLKTATTLIQMRKLKLYSARLSCVCFKVLATRQLTEIHQMILNLCLYGDLSVDMVELFLNNTGLVIPPLANIREIMQSPQHILDELSVIKASRPTVSTLHLEYLKKTKEADTQNVLDGLPKPVFNNDRLLINELCKRVIKHSPSPAIRSCSQVVKQNHAFREHIFPIAFLSCWMNTFKIHERTQISKIIIMILENFEKIDPTIFKLIELADRAGFPLLVPDNVLAKSSKNPGLSIYYYQKHLRENPCARESINELIGLYSRQGFKSSAYGILSTFSSKLNQVESGKWYEQLGEWDKALDIYEKQANTDISTLIQCYGHLQLWDNIKSFSNKYEKMSQEEKDLNSLWFAWAEYHTGNLDKVKHYMNPNANDLPNILFRIIYSIASGDYNLASKTIELGFKKLSEQTEVFNGSDTNQASNTMVYAQNLVELKEALKMKQENATTIPQIWQNRLKNFSHESDAWIKLIDIRCLVLRPEDHIASYIKMISVLRAERKWKLVDVYYSRFLSSIKTPDTVLTNLKNHWARDSKQFAISFLSAFNKLLGATSEEKVEHIIQKCPQHKSRLIEIFDFSEETPKIQSIKHYIQKNMVNDETTSRLLRIQAEWEYHLYSGQTSPVTKLIKISKLFERANSLVPNDYRTWGGWAYTNSRALSHVSDLRGQFALNAICGFLKATQLCLSHSLEYLCQMFSIIFRYADSLELSKQISSEIISLPPSIIEQIIPQIVVHISHANQQVSHLVQNIISVFGTDHFQAVIYHLNLLSMLSNSENNNNISKNILESLAYEHPTEYADAKLLITNLHLAAVSWIENWINSIDKAFKAQQKGKKDFVIKIISDQFKATEKPKCEMDRSLIRQFGASLTRCKSSFEKYVQGANSSTRLIWDNLRTFFNELTAHFKKMNSIDLNRISKELVLKRGFSIAIPGTYEISNPVPKLDYIEPNLTILSTQAHPRSLFMVNMEGLRFKFLLKGNEDLRLDQRIMKFFKLVNNLLSANRNTNNLGVSILLYAVVPFAPNAGLISWLTGSDAIQQVVNDYRAHRHIRKNIEAECYGHFCGQIYSQLTSLQKSEVFFEVASKTQACEIREMLWLRSPNPYAWMQRNRNYTISTAIMSMAGYTIGLGDRHPNNIMIQRHTGRVIHIDFGDSFEVAMKRIVYAERVPFRLTRMIVNALDGGRVDGLFRNTCEDILWVLRNSQSSLIALLEVFVHEPIFNIRDFQSNKSQSRAILERVAKKLSGADPIPIDSNIKVLNVSEQVSTLINIASDPMEYSRHFLGWCPFW